MNTVRLLSIAAILLFAVGATATAQSYGLLDLATLQAHQQALIQQFQTHPVASYGLYMGTLIILVSFSIPGTMAYMLFAGAAFDLPQAVAIVIVCRAVGAVCAFLAARHLAREWIRARLGKRLQRLDSGVNREGWLYLAMLRLAPVLPDSVINPGMGLTSISLPVFFWVSVVGMIPWVLLYTAAGDRLANLSAESSIVEPQWLVLLSAASVILFLVVRAWQRLPATGTPHSP